MKVLLIEDNQVIAKQVIEFLSAQQYQMDYAHNGKMGIQLALNHIFDVIVLDLNLPDIDGIQVCKAIKSTAQITPPILMLTARDSFEDKSEGFQQGADDYLTKPFDLRELALRCQALTRRQTLYQRRTLELGELFVDVSNQKVTRQNKNISLTSIGFQILTILIQSYPNAVSRSTLTHKIWSDSPPDSDALKSHIYTLRKSLDKPFSTSMLTTVMNVGYKLEVCDETD